MEHTGQAACRALGLGSWVALLACRGDGDRESVTRGAVVLTRGLVGVLRLSGEDDAGVGAASALDPHPLLLLLALEGALGSVNLYQRMGL